MAQLFALSQRKSCTELHLAAAGGGRIFTSGWPYDSRERWNVTSFYRHNNGGDCAAESLHSYESPKLGDRSLVTQWHSAIAVLDAVGSDKMGAEAAGYDS
ncbi:hypothetical protein RRG08_056553 [Elysia crispata]|uniref:Uncharacterized protein n=1 Tax=Elysia crispata TaxID=231223 RepID=A0AAE1CWS6_9GAST|nr:hypothetical protein RRG08_056553 [Elysia crispata]